MVARLAAFSNITYDLGDDLDSFRDEKWVHETGTLIESWDLFKHLATSHPVQRQNQDRASDWFGFTSLQNWRPCGSNDPEPPSSGAWSILIEGLFDNSTGRHRIGCRQRSGNSANCGQPG